MITSINKYSGELASLYSLYVDSLRAEYIKILTGKLPASPAQRRKFESLSRAKAETMIEEYRVGLTGAMNEIVRKTTITQFTESEVAIAMTNKKRADIADSIRWAVNESAAFIGSLAVSDIRHASKSLRSIALDAAMTPNTQTAIKTAVVRKLAEGDIYSKNDRQWPSISKARLTTRFNLLTVGNEVVMLMGMMLGEDQFRIVNAEGHRYNNKTISISGVVGDKYADIKDKIFHPNSDSFVYRKISKW